MSLQKQIDELIEKHTGKPSRMIAVRTKYIDITGSLTSATLLSQIVYWSERTKDIDGWFYKSDTDWYEELRLKRFSLNTAKSTLLSQGLIETQVRKDSRGRPVTHYRLVPNFDYKVEEMLGSSIDSDDENNKSETLEDTVPSCGNPTIVNDGSIQAQMSEANESYITKNTAIEYAKHTRTYIVSEDCEEILQRWNDYSITVALSITKALRIALDELVQVCSLADFYTAMDNYAKIVVDEQYYFKHKYSLETFISAGLKKNKGFVHFLDANEPFIRFRESKEEKPIIFTPVTERYNQSKKADFERNTYYGFDIDSIKTIDSRMDDVDYMLSKDKIKWTFGKFWALEMCIASLLFKRKTDPQPDKLSMYMEAWEDNVETFEGMLEN